jgi:hypothetical protein
LISGVNSKVHGFPQHRRPSGETSGHKLADCDRDIGNDSGVNSLLASRHPPAISGECQWSFQLSQPVFRPASARSRSCWVITLAVSVKLTENFGLPQDFGRRFKTRTTAQNIVKAKPVGKYRASQCQATGWTKEQWLQTRHSESRITLISQKLGNKQR